MLPTEVDLLDEKDKIVIQPPQKIKPVAKKAIYFFIVIGIVIAIYGFGIISSSENLAKTFGNVSLFQQVQSLVGSADKKLVGEDQDRINILLTGIGGKNHDGPYLTDSMMVVSLKPSAGQAALISLPRDLVVPIPGYGWYKINSANSYGETKGAGAGSKLAATVVSDVLGITIDYYLRIDFSGFAEIIDNLGGVTVNVENTLDDPHYPVPGKENAPLAQRYEHLYITAGKHYFDGQTALKFARSREAIGVEGSDFARSKRQQKIILAIKDKALSFETLINPYRLGHVFDGLSEHLNTNLQLWEVMRLYQLGKQIDQQKIINKVFDNSPDSPLYNTTTADGAWVLRPKAGDFSELQDITRNIFDPAAAANSQPLRLEVQNGTKIEGLASQTANQLKAAGYKSISTKNAPTQDYQRTVIYQLKNTAKTSEAITKISGLLNAPVAASLPSWLTSTSSQAVSPYVDILIILGQDQANLN